MKVRALYAAAAGFLAGYALRGRLACWWTGHDPRRVRLGFLLCSKCGKKGADYTAFGVMDGGSFVKPPREDGPVTRLRKAGGL